MKTIRLLIIFTLVLSLTSVARAANVSSKPGDGEIPDTGELYGDLYVILRDVDGVPILSYPNQCIQPISTVTASTTIDIWGEEDLTINVVEGEPFALPSYLDAAGDEVECELTEAMAEWVEAVDFGRLNLGRAPEGVIAHAFDEAINKMNVASDMWLDPAGRIVLMVPSDEDPLVDVEKTIDAPAENLALYIEMMKSGDWVITVTDPIVKGGPPEGKGPPEGDGPSSEPRPVLNESAIALLNGLGFTSLGVDDTVVSLNQDEFILAASLLAAAADKTGSITLDKVVYINSVYGINQAGSLPGEIEGKTYFDFSAFTYDRNATFGDRGSEECIDDGPSFVWVLQPEVEVVNEVEVEVEGHFVTRCMDLLGYDPESTYNAVRFTNMVEEYQTAVDWDAEGNPIPIPGFTFDGNVRGFTQAADDALRVIEYIHNYKIPEVLYP